MSKTLKQKHQKLKDTRQRGSVTPSNLATFQYLKSLEAELDRVRVELSNVWAKIDSPRDYLKCMIHMDAAQQRLHHVIKRISK